MIRQNYNGRDEEDKTVGNVLFKIFCLKIQSLWTLLYYMQRNKKITRNNDDYAGELWWYEYKM